MTPDPRTCPCRYDPVYPYAHDSCIEYWDRRDKDGNTEEDRSDIAADWQREADEERADYMRDMERDDRATGHKE